MKVLRNKPDMVPINVLPGDTLTLYYVDEDGTRTSVLSETLTEAQIIDAAAIVRLDADEADQLGMEDGALGGIFGKGKS